MVTTQTQSPLVQLRRLLDETERAVVIMYETPGGPAEVLRAVDTISDLVEQLDAEGVDVRGERARMDDLLRRLAGGAQRLVRHVRASGGDAALADSGTWRALAEAADADARARSRRWLRWATGVVAAVLLVCVVLPWAFPGQPVVNTSNIIARAQEGDYAAALELAKAEQARVPTDPQGHLWVGALELRQGNAAAAETAFGEARRLSGDDRAFYGTRGPLLLELGMVDAAEADARTMLAQPATAPNGHFLLGQVYGARGQAPEAIRELQTASDLADQAGDAVLAVTAKLAMQSIMQSPPPPVTPTAAS
jgi:tetratricopeptide (TPR) repeat protein